MGARAGGSETHHAFLALWVQRSSEQHEKGDPPRLVVLDGLKTHDTQAHDVFLIFF